jgi:nitric oxide synthase oxygenase domain/subunit
MMAGMGFLSLNSRVKQALSAVSVFLNPQQTKNVQSFLQARAPFTGSYTSQSGQIVGILKSMRDTFKENLATARSTEKQQKDSHEKLMVTLNKAYDKMSATYDRRQEGMGDNDDNLATKKEQLVEAKEQKANDEEYWKNSWSCARRRPRSTTSARCSERTRTQLLPRQLQSSTATNLLLRLERLMLPAPEAQDLLLSSCALGECESTPVQSRSRSK